MEINMVEKVVATAAALELIELLKDKHGPVCFHQSGGCCDNSAANCYLPGELTIGAGDEYLGDIGGFPFYISKSQYEMCIRDRGSGSSNCAWPRPHRPRRGPSGTSRRGGGRASLPKSSQS